MLVLLLIVLVAVLLFLRVRAYLARPRILFEVRMWPAQWEAVGSFWQAVAQRLG